MGSSRWLLTDRKVAQQNLHGLICPSICPFLLSRHSSESFFGPTFQGEKSFYVSVYTNKIKKKPQCVHGIVPAGKKTECISKLMHPLDRVDECVN